MVGIDKIRLCLRNSTLDFLGLFAHPASGIHLLNGHMIARSNPRIDTFLDQLKDLKKVADFIRIEDAVDLINKRVEVKDTLLAFTFDDGFEECATMIAPALETYGVNGLFFINPNFADGDEQYIENFTKNIVMTSGKRPMRWPDIIDLHKRGHIIGAHTMDHKMINDYDLEDLNYQIGNCKLVIENKLDAPCDYFAFPYGRLDHANAVSIEVAMKYYKYIFSQSDYKKYFSYDGKVINRRHFEPYWSVNHVKYFISHPKEY